MRTEENKIQNRKFGKKSAVKVDERQLKAYLFGQQWRRQLWGTGHLPPPSTFNNFIFSSLWSKSQSQLSKYCVVCEIS